MKTQIVFEYFKIHTGNILQNKFPLMKQTGFGRDQKKNIRSQDAKFCSRKIFSQALRGRKLAFLVRLVAFTLASHRFGELELASKALVSETVSSSPQL